MVLGWINVVNNVQPCRCSANGIQRRSDVVMLSVKWYGGTSVSCQTNALQEKMYTNLGNKWDSSQEKEGVGAANKPKGNVWASVQVF